MTDRIDEILQRNRDKSFMPFSTPYAETHQIVVPVMIDAVEYLYQVSHIPEADRLRLFKAHTKEQKNEIKRAVKYLKGVK